jgi:hypothetical protein
MGEIGGGTAMIPIDWAKERYQFRDDRYVLDVRSGISIALQNHLTILRLHSVKEALEIESEIYALGAEAASKDRGMDDTPNIPNFLMYKRPTSRGELNIVLMWGIVLNGSRQRSALMGSWIFLAVLPDQVEGCLDEHFNLERVCTIE